MTAHLLDRPVAPTEVRGEMRAGTHGQAPAPTRRSATRPAPRPTVPVGPGAGPDRRTTAWRASSARACSGVAPAPRTVSSAAPAATGQLSWTPRGVAVMVILVALVVGFMVATLVSSFLAVSNDPLPAAEAAVVVSAVRGG